MRLFDEIQWMNSKWEFSVPVNFFHPILNVRLFDEIINSKLGIFVFGDFFPLYGLVLFMH